MLRMLTRMSCNMRTLCVQVSLSEAARVAYVDATDGDKEGYVRCVDADAAATLVQRQQPGLQLSLLTGTPPRRQAATAQQPCASAVYHQNLYFCVFDSAFMIMHGLSTLV